ncbi:hypothetical protein VPH35_007523 [Triticum aestivum]
MANSEYEYVKREFEFDHHLPASNWIIVCLDGCHFHRFSKIHAFEKPNDESALRLMNACASSILEEFPDIVFSYGVRASLADPLKEPKLKILSLCVSYITPVYVMKLKDFFPNKELREAPYFDGRVVCYPNMKTIRDYLAWRQLDCHNRIQYKTCFWMLVKSRKGENEAYDMLKFEYVKREFEFDHHLPASNWIIVCLDGCHFHRFSKIHAFEKPNDESALRLMNACASSILEEFPDIVFSYGVRASLADPLKEPKLKILSLCVSYITPVYVMKLKDFFPNKELREAPYFDGRVVCYPNMKTIRDYLGTFSKDKNELLSQQFQIIHDDESTMFRKGSKRMTAGGRCCEWAVTHVDMRPEFWRTHRRGRGFVSRSQEQVMTK